MSKLNIKQLTEKVRGKVEASAVLAPYTSWRTGGPADLLYIPADAEDLAVFLTHIPKNVPLTWLGLGSNTLIRDKGVEGIVIVTQSRLNQLSQLEEKIIRAEAGVSSAQLARFSARLGLCGIEFLAGIPGTVGGALAMNAGCFGGETWHFVHAVETVNREGIIRIRPRSDFIFSYRQVKKPEQEWFVAGHFLLQKGDKTTSLETIRELLESRNNTQPTGTANCGSVFKNPLGDYSGRLIDNCNLKGKTVGGATVSPKHANFIVNEHAATSTDIENLIDEIRSIVLQKTGVRLIPEVCIIGRL